MTSKEKDQLFYAIVARISYASPRTVEGVKNMISEMKQVYPQFSADLEKLKPKDVTKDFMAIEYGDKMILAPRGTEGARDLFGQDTYIAAGALPPRHEEFNQYVQAMKQQYPGKENVYVGHSLGGSLSKIQGIRDNAESYCYNAPNLPFEAYAKVIGPESAPAMQQAKQEYDAYKAAQLEEYRARAQTFAFASQPQANAAILSHNLSNWSPGSLAAPNIHATNVAGDNLVSGFSPEREKWLASDKTTIETTPQGLFEKHRMGHLTDKLYSEYKAPEPMNDLAKANHNLLYNEFNYNSNKLIEEKNFGDIFERLGGNNAPSIYSTVMSDFAANCGEINAVDALHKILNTNQSSLVVSPSDLKLINQNPKEVTSSLLNERIKFQEADENKELFQNINRALFSQWNNALSSEISQLQSVPRLTNADILVNTNKHINTNFLEQQTFHNPNQQTGKSVNPGVLQAKQQGQQQFRNPNQQQNTNNVPDVNPLNNKK